MEFAVLISLASLVLGIFILIVFFQMASNIKSIANHIRNMDYRNAELNDSLDKIIKTLEKHGREKV